VIFSGPDWDADMVAVSPDGSQLAFAASCGNFARATLRVVALSNVADACKAGRALDGVTLLWTRPTWGANGLFAYDDGLGMLDLWTVPETGGKPTNLLTTEKQTATGGRYLGEVAWSPPGTPRP
jgi:hypothetical protein